MNELTISNQSKFGQVRTWTDESGKVWYCGKDICDYLQYSNITSALKRHVQDTDKIKHATLLAKREECGKNQVQSMVYINKGGFYSLVLNSQMPQAREFYNAVTHEVLPTIEEKGAYMTESFKQQCLADPDFLFAIVSQWKKDREEKILANEEAARLRDEVRERDMTIALQEPRVNFSRAIEGSDRHILIRDLATLLWQSGVRLRQKDLFAELIKRGYLYKTRGQFGKREYRPTQKSKDMELMVLVEYSIEQTNTTITTFTTKITGKGQVYFVNLFLREQEVEYSPTLELINN